MEHEWIEENGITICKGCRVWKGTNRSDECRGAPPVLSASAYRCNGGMPTPKPTTPRKR